MSQKYLSFPELIRDYIKPKISKKMIISNFFLLNKLFHIKQWKIFEQKYKLHVFIKR